ncbi:MAG: cytochrome c oxidase assembly protein [Alphaproteobacteria bacterium]|nr:MAG: cytochrome c oxidase assembly protein [Alphaproteobacteria bacterium]
MHIMDKNQHDKNTKTLLSVFGVVFLMIALSFASVPLYNLFCKVTGFAGTTQLSQSLPDTILDRTMTVQFTTDVNKNLPWTFKADQANVTLKIGQDALINFVAKNKSNKAVAGTAVYNVTPPKAGKYFHKTQCFCFDHQILQPHQSMNMPVVFYIDPSIAGDPNMEDVKVITLSYSFFKSDSSELDEAVDIFYNSDTK